VLLSADLRQTGTGVTFLRAKRILEDTVTGIPTPLWKVREAWSKLGMLLELLTSPSGDVSLPLGSDLTRAGTVAEESMAVAIDGDDIDTLLRGGQIVVAPPPSCRALTPHANLLGND